MKSRTALPSRVSKSAPNTRSSGYAPEATRATKGMRFAGTPLGSSPSRPEGCAPTGLK